MVFTAVEIKAFFNTVVFPSPVKRINAYVEMDEGRRKYTSIDIENVTGIEELEAIPTSTTEQIFLIHLYVRVRGTGEEQESQVKSLEDIIFSTLDAEQTVENSITVLQSWERKHEVFPVARVHSILRVSADTISSNVTNATPGNKITMTIPPNFTDLPVINLASDEAGIIKDLDLTVSASEIFTKIQNNGFLSVEFVLTPAQEVNMRSLVLAGNNTDITLTKGGTSQMKTINPINIVHTATRDQIQTSILSMDVIYEN